MCLSAKFRLKSVSGDFRSVGNPVRRRKGNPPEIGRRLQEFDANLGLSLAFRIHADDAAGLFLTGLWILQDNNLANPYGEIQTDQGSVSRHDQGMSLLPGHLLVSTCRNHRD
jgi:hypothetical protein